MTLTEINQQFKACTDAVAGLNGYSFGWPSDRVRSQTYDNPGEDAVDLYPRVLFAVPTLEQDLIGRNDSYQCQVFFDDLLGYDDDGETVPETQAQKWDTLRDLCTAWCRQMQTYRTTGHIQGPVNMSLDSFGGSQRLISVVATFTFVTKSVC